MTNPNNVAVIADRLIAYLRTTKDDYIRSDLVAKVTQLAERFAPDNLWFIQTMNAIFELGESLQAPSNSPLLYYCSCATKWSVFKCPSTSCCCSCATKWVSNVFSTAQVARVPGVLVPHPLLHITAHVLLDGSHSLVPHITAHVLLGGSLESSTTPFPIL